MKKILPILMMLPLLMAASDKTVQEAYIEKYSDIAVAEMHRTGVPASITLAQGILESNSGQSSLAVDGNNHFGIKCHGWKGRTITHDDETRGECFRAYDTPEDSFRDHSDFLRYSDRYKALFAYEPTDYLSWAEGLKAAGYATDPLYPSKLVGIIEKYNLSRFDKVGAEDIPQTPQSLEVPEKVPDDNADDVVNKADEEVVLYLSRVYMINGVRFVYVQEGETMGSIADSYDMHTSHLLRCNDLKSDRPLVCGEVIYLDGKKNKAARGLDKYVVGENGETLWDISQRFAVKLKSLCKMNGFDEDHVPEEGDTIILR